MVEPSRQKGAKPKCLQYFINLKTVCFHFRKKLLYLRDLHKTRSFGTSISLLFFLFPFPSFTLTLLFHIFSPFAGLLLEKCWTLGIFSFVVPVPTDLKVVSSEHKICSNLF